MRGIRNTVILLLVAAFSFFQGTGTAGSAGNPCDVCNAVLNSDIEALSRFSPEEYEKIQARTSDGIPSTALHLAVEKGDLNVIKKLNTLKVNWNATDQFKATPLLLAVFNNRKDIVEVLIKGGADPNAATIFGTSAFCYAPTRTPGIMDVLLDTNKYPDNSNPLVDAIASGNLSMVEELYPCSKKHIKKQDILLDIAANYGHDDIVSYLADEFDISSEKTKILEQRSKKNRERYKEYIDCHNTPIEVKPVRDEFTGKKGYYTCKLKEFSPYTDEKPGQYLYDIPFSVYVPQSYTKEKPAGLMIYISGGYPNKAYKKSLDRHNLIWAGVNCKKFDMDDILMDKQPHSVFSLAMVYYLAGHYNVDPSRIYIAGFSWGGRLAGRILYQYPKVFKGGISCGGCQVITKESSDSEGYIDSFEYARKMTSLVIITGDKDFNRKEAYSMYEFLQLSQFQNVHYIQQPKRGHVPVTGENFERAVRLLDERGR